MILPALTASNSLSPSSCYSGTGSIAAPGGISPAEFDLNKCITGCAPGAIGCITECGTDFSCWMRCGGMAAVGCLLACI